MFNPYRFFSTAIFSMGLALGLGHFSAAIAQIDPPPDRLPPGLEDVTQPDPVEILPVVPGGPSPVIPPTFTGDPNPIIEQIENHQSDPYSDYLGITFYGELANADLISQTLKKLGNKTGTNPALVYVLSTSKGLKLVLLLPEGAVDPLRSHLPFLPNGIKIASLHLWPGLAQAPSPPSPLRSFAVPNVSRDEIRRVTKTFRTEVSDPSKVETNSYQPSAKQLYDWMIAPLKPSLDANKIDTLIFSLDKGFRSMPIAALFDGQQFLVEQYNLALIPSFSLTDTRYQDIRGSKMLGMGITQSAGGLTPLPGVSVEVPTLTNRIWQGQGYLDGQVTLDQFKALTRREQFSIVHLATHAEFNPGNVNQSFIQFWDGRLTLPQLRKVALSQQWSNAPTLEMLVLSACQTALGNEKAELGFTGLAVQTGVKTAIGSLWSVNDAGTLGVMSEFYQQLKTASTRAAALRAAQVGLLRRQVKLADGKLQLTDGAQVDLPPAIAQQPALDLSHPYYWAAYTVVGNWN
ncbi:MAG: CHAT domain-containing protein [Thermosynechococcaceae cyanobacterium]